MNFRWMALLAAVIVLVSTIPFAVAGCNRDKTVSLGGVNQDMVTDTTIKTEVATFALG